MSPTSTREPVASGLSLLLVLALATITAAAFQGSRGLYETTEGRYVECARQTLETGRLDEPMLNGEHHWTKPPLAYVCIAAGLKTFGENTWGARAFLVAAFLLTVGVVYGLGWGLWGRQAAGYCALVYALSPFPLAAANVVSTDTLLALWEGLMLLCFWWGVRSRKRAWFLGFWLATAMAFMTKGPAGLLPLCGIVPVYVILRRRGEDVPRLFTLAGIVVFLGVGLGWYLIEASKYPHLLNYWIKDEIVGRNVKGEFNRNPEFYKAFIIYLPIVLFGTLPWLALVLIKAKRIPWPRGKWLRWLTWPQGIEWTFLLLSVLAPLVILSVSKSKLPLYVLPLFVPLCLMVGQGVSWLVTQGGLRKRTVLIAACVMVLAAVAGKGTVARMPFHSDMKQLAGELKPILDKYPESPLYAIKRRPLNGLQFYLGATVPVISVLDLPRLTGLDGGSPHVVPPLILITAGDVKKLGLVTDVTKVHLEKVSPFWALIVGDAPIPVEVPEEARAQLEALSPGGPDIGD